MNMDEGITRTTRSISLVAMNGVTCTWLAIEIAPFIKVRQLGITEQIFMQQTAILLNVGCRTQYNAFFKLIFRD
jgi:hypothetical protein